jgi:hypothetical protein
MRVQKKKMFLDGFGLLKGGEKHEDESGIDAPLLSFNSSLLFEQMLEIRFFGEFEIVFEDLLFCLISDQLLSLNPLCKFLSKVTYLLARIHERQSFDNGCVPPSEQQFSNSDHNCGKSNWYKSEAIG